MTTSERPRSVLVVDDAFEARRWLTAAIDDEADLEVAGVAGDGVVALYLAEDVHPDVVVLDHEMPRLTGLEALPELRRLLPEARIVVWSSAVHVRDQVCPNGGDAFIAKSEPVRQLLQWLRQA